MAWRSPRDRERIAPAVERPTPGSAKTPESAKSCLECHGEDPGWREAQDDAADLARATGYLSAMHENCVACHEEEAQLQNRETLGDCSTCHRSLGPGVDALLVRAAAGEEGGGPEGVPPARGATGD